jgi:hypothetical protein
MNDIALKDYGVIAVSEPYAKLVNSEVVTSPAGHRNWTKITPTQKHDALWPIRSMLWVRHNIEVEQVPIPSADLTAAVLRLPDRDVLVVSVYVQGKKTELLVATITKLHEVIQRFRGEGADEQMWYWRGTSTATTYSGPETRFRQEDKAKPSLSSI